MSATPRLLTVAILVPLVLSGCAFPGGGDGKAFDPVDAPVWEPGYTWSYDVVSSSQSSGFGSDGIGSDGDSDRGKVTMKVINTTMELDGEPLYVVSMEDAVDHPIFNGDMQAITQRALEIAAIGYRHDYYYERPSPERCHGSSPLYRVDAEEQFPMLRFPLDDGASWSGTIGFVEPVAMEYTMTAHGLVDVDTPAGTFEAVYVTTEFKPGELPEDARDEIGLFDLSLRSEQWYSPDVRYLVKHVFTASASAREQGEQYRFAYRTTAVLTDYALQAGPEEPSPEIIDNQENVAVPYYPTRIVSDTVFPVNIADGPVTARLTLEQMNGRSSRGFDSGTIATVEELKPFQYDNETHEIGWTVTSYNSGFGEEKTYTGDVLELSLDRGGEYQVRAAIQPKECGGHMMGDAYGTASAFWSKTFTFGTDTGDLPGTFPIGKVPVEANAYEGLVNWIRKPKAGYSPDSGNLLIRGPDGRTQSFPTNQVGESAFAAYPAGTYELFWQTNGLPSVGENIDLTVTITYGYMWH